MGLKKSLTSMVVAGAVFMGGCICHNSGNINSRFGSLPYPKISTNFPDPNSLGVHNGNYEKKGQIYCCDGGFIDVAHLRKGADFANVYTKMFYDNLMKGKEKFEFKMKEPCDYEMKIDYPNGWGSWNKDRKKRIASDVAIELGEYSSFLGTTWHELLTTYGYKMTGIIPEYHSAFTIDDNFSNFLGSYLSARVLERNKEIFNGKELDEELFNKKFSVALERELEKLGALSPENTKKACDKTEEKNRHLNIGLDGRMEPYLLKNFDKCSGQRVSYPTPALNVGYGFLVNIGIEPHSGAGKKIRELIGKEEGLIYPKTEMNEIMEDAEKRVREMDWNPVY